MDEIAGEQIEAAKRRLVALSERSSEQGFGVTATGCLTAGTIVHWQVRKITGVDPA